MDKKELYNFVYELRNTNYELLDSFKYQLLNAIDNSNSISEFLFKFLEIESDNQDFLLRMDLEQKRASNEDLRIENENLAESIDCLNKDNEDLLSTNARLKEEMREQKQNKELLEEIKKGNQRIKQVEKECAVQIAKIKDECETKVDLEKAGVAHILQENKRLESLYEEHLTKTLHF